MRNEIYFTTFYVLGYVICTVSMCMYYCDIDESFNKLTILGIIFLTLISCRNILHKGSNIPQFFTGTNHGAAGEVWSLRKYE